MNKLFKPFEYVAGVQALAIGLLVAALSIVIGLQYGVRFDGVLDMHVAQIKTWQYYTLEQIINLSSLSLVFYAAKMMLKSQARVIDIIGTLSMARIPILLGGMVALAMPNSEMQALTAHPEAIDIAAMLAFLKDHLFIIIPVGLALLTLIVYYIQLLWQSFKTCFNRTDSNAVLSFIAALIVAEIISKIALYYLS